MITDERSLIELTRRWIEEDPDPETREELEAILAAGNLEELADRFGGTLRFGTAGLRGKLGAGPRRMNRAVILRTVAGICANLLESVPNAQERGLCIGYDARHKSRILAEDATAVARGAGFSVYLFDRPVPTPLVAFSLLDRHAAGALVVTASHNPREYNGLKVYGPEGPQIIPPMDEAIAAAIERAPAPRAIPRVDAQEPTPLEGAPGSLTTLGPTDVERYLSAISRVIRPPANAASLKIAYTALHGVGAEFTLRALAQAGFTNVDSVDSQQDPDPDFPTVPSPNPEDPRALSAVIELAELRGADLVLANDPDADRLAVAVSDGARFRILGGNEIGALLAHYLLQRDGGGPSVLLISSFVSSPVLGDIARFHGATWSQTLTGHKWIHHEALRLERDGLRFAFGYEEALGYAVGNAVRDKDGISAAVLLAELAANLKARGLTLIEELDAMAARYGGYTSRQRSRIHDGTDGEAVIAMRMARARTSTPGALGGCLVTASCDFLEGQRRPTHGEPTPLGLPPSDVVAFELEGGHRAMLRPSGTEPKLKLYVDVRVEPGSIANGGKHRAETLAEAILNDLEAYLED